jgi:hypothetical protein
MFVLELSNMRNIFESFTIHMNLWCEDRPGEYVLSEQRLVGVTGVEACLGPTSEVFWLSAETLIPVIKLAHLK